MKALILVRHARAGKRELWTGDDRLRPLDEMGRRQADGLPAVLQGYEIERILSSPYHRCVQTVEPLAAERHLDLEERTALAEGAPRSEVRSLLAELDGLGAVLCTHGDVVQELLGEGMKKGEARVVVPGSEGVRATAAIPPSD